MSAWGAAASVVGGFLGFGSQERTNRINQREAQKNRDFQAGEASTNRSFQERMRNTAWQSAVEDMRAAGVNPAMALQRGPAASPGGSMASGSQAAPAGDSFSSAMQGAQQSKALKLMDAQVDKSRAEADTARAGADLAQRRRHFFLDSFEVNGRRSPPLFNDLLMSELATARAGATNMAALSDRNRALAQIAGPMAGLSNRMGELLPILGGLGAAAGPASSFIRALRGGRLFSRARRGSPLSMSRRRPRGR